MRILVLGGTVFLTRAVAEEALRRGHEVVCACRGSAPLPEGAGHVPLDRARQHPRDLLADEYDAVVDPGRTPSWVRAAVEALPSAHWVLVSTVSVYADGVDASGAPVQELVAPIWTDEDLRTHIEAYGGMKVACERIVTEGVPSSTVVRPGLIVGPGDPSGRFTYWPVRLAEPGPVLAPAPPSAPVQVVDVRDLAGLVVTCAERRTGGVLDGVGPVLSWQAFLHEVAEGVGAAPDLRWADPDRLLEAGLQPWAGPDSLPVWIPGEEGVGVLARDPGPAQAAGMLIRSLAHTARDTRRWVEGTPDARVDGIDRAREKELLASLAVG